MHLETFLQYLDHTVSVTIVPPHNLGDTPTPRTYVGVLEAVRAKHVDLRHKDGDLSRLAVKEIVQVSRW